MTLTDFEIRREWQYRFQARIAVLCGQDNPTQYQLEIAMKEADQWRADYAASLAEPMLL